MQAASEGIEDDMAAAGLGGSRSPTPEATPQVVASTSTNQEAVSNAAVSVSLACASVSKELGCLETK